jgi:4-hydroxythreonine-4-phosphate dehydrogenase
MDKYGKLHIGITHGDLNGVGYELIIKTLMDQRLYELFTPVVYGSSKVASYHRKTLNVPDFSFNIVRNAESAQDNKPNLINLVDKEVKIDLGKSTEIAGELALLALETAITDIKSGAIDVLVTAPINKKNIQSTDFHFPGHTEYLASKFGCEDVLMLMVRNQLRIGMITGHIALKEVSNTLTSELILRKIKTLHASLLRDFGIGKPKIAILALNPHASDNGLIGDEEEKVIIPAINQANEQDMMVFGPYAADGFFASMNYKHFDAILAMYHDQGMIPFKALAFDTGVNFTAGLPIVRTSPAHGTAYEIAGKDNASIDSFREALYLSIDIYNNRLLYDELHLNQLKPTEEKTVSNEV